MNKYTQRITLLKNGMIAITEQCVCGCQLFSSRKIYSKIDKKILGYNYKCKECNKIYKDLA